MVYKEKIRTGRPNTDNGGHYYTLGDYLHHAYKNNQSTFLGAEAYTHRTFSLDIVDGFEIA